MKSYGICLWVISLSIIPSRFIHVVTNGRTLFFYGSVIFCYIYVHQLFYSLVLLPYLGCCNNDAINIGCMCLFELAFWVSSDIYSEVKNGLQGSSIFNFLRNLHTLFPQWLYQSAFPSTMHKDSLLSTSSPTLVCGFTADSHCDRWEMISHCGFNVHFLMVSGIGHLFVCLFAIHMFSSKKCLLLRSSVLFVFVVEIYEILPVLDINPLSGVSLTNILFYAIGCLFVLLMVVFSVKNFLVWCTSICLFIFCFLGWGDISEKSIAKIVRDFTAYVFF